MMCFQIPATVVVAYLAGISISLKHFIPPYDVLI